MKPRISSWWKNYSNRFTSDATIFLFDTYLSPGDIVSFEHLDQSFNCKHEFGFGWYPALIACSIYNGQERYSIEESVLMVNVTGVRTNICD